MKKILFTLLTLVAVVGLTPAFSAVAYADCGSATDPTGQALGGISETGDNCSGAGVKSLLHTIISLLSYIAGAVAIIMIIVAGFKYITSSGDAAKITSAKNTLIYAMVGIAVAVLAQLLVNFAFTTAKNATEPPKSSKSP